MQKETEACIMAMQKETEACIMAMQGVGREASEVVQDVCALCSVVWVLFGYCKVCPLRVVPCWIDGVRAGNCTPSPMTTIDVPGSG